MARYIYTAKSSPTQIIQGNIDADSQQDAINKLNKMGYFPVSVRSEDLSSDRREGVLNLRKVSNKDLVVFTRQLSTLIESGVNILNSLNIITNQASNKYMKSILSDITDKIKDGKPLSDSMAAHPYLFSALYTSMIRSGEAAGTIGQVLKSLADFMEKEEEFKNSIRAALTYPFFIFIVSTLTVVVLLTFVIPRLVVMFEDMGQALPLPTKILINISGALRSYWWLILIVGSFFIFFLRRLSRSPQGKVSMDRLKLKLPIMGQITLKTEVSRLMRTLSLLLSSGVPIVSSLDISMSVVGNQIIIGEVEKFRDNIINGSSFSDCLVNSKLFPMFVTNIITVGEETGTLEKAFNRISDEYEREVDRSLKALVRLLEPVIILVMGVIVGFIVLSMLLPIFQINLIAR